MDVSMASTDAGDISALSAPAGSVGGAGDGDVMPGYSPYYRDYSILIEYKHLKHHAPGGIYVLPSFDSLFEWYGVIFIRQGLYRGGIFKFLLSIPEDYPNSRPSVQFFSKVYHPLIDHQGNLDLSSQFATWTPRKDYILHILAFIKKIFYHIDTCLESPINKEAADLYYKKREEFISRVEPCVKDSQNRVYDNPSRSSMLFSDYNEKHQQMSTLLLDRKSAGDMRDPVLQWFGKFVSKFAAIHAPEVEPPPSAPVNPPPVEPQT
eukprot:GFYU01002832.1.p1 GENE.GFYU01002832.1~~GFYU01002832.1.p1  ORF type:complete len:264 (+),score=34.81 GFYU01002832.1:181-972(+)